jgi:hypothetical protein
LFFDRAQRSGEICGAAVLSWKCFSTEGSWALRVCLRARRAALRRYRATEKFGTGQERQGLKPDLFPIVYGPTKVVP